MKNKRTEKDIKEGRKEIENSKHTANADVLKAAKKNPTSVLMMGFIFLNRDILKNLKFLSHPCWAGRSDTEPNGGSSSPGSEMGSPGSLE